MAETDSRLIDVASALTRVGGNEGLFKRLLGKFEASVDIVGFNEAIASQDYLKAGEIVHAAKGIAGNLSLTYFFTESNTLMEQLRNGGTPQPENIELFRKSFAETLAAVNAFLAE
jgi:HPt (histidine-containing phosphotransfer) domain-containing protein